jgi:peptide/nickel transport system substrate-binding protein
MSTKKVVTLLVILLTMGLLVAPHSISAADKKVVVAIGMEPTTIDPSSSYLGSADYQVAENYAEYLIYRAPNGDLKPGLAASWKVSPDGKVIEFTLRRGVKFHSGDSLTAKDVEFSFERGQAKSSSVKTRLKLVDRFEIIDDYRFKVHFKMPDVTFIRNRGGAMIVSKTYFDRVGEDAFSKQPAGTGPYKFVRYVPGEYMDMERFDGYYGEKPSVKEARIVFIPEDSTRVSKLKAGEVDLIAACPYPLVVDIEKSPEFKTARLPVGHPTVSVGFSTMNPNNPWHDKRVRLAMAYAIDYDSILNKVLFGIANRWAFVMPHEPGYDPNVKPYPYDPKKARELLVEAGYAKGFEFKYYWLASGRYPMSREVTEAIGAYWEAVGLRPKLIGEEFVANINRVRSLKKPDSDYVCIGAYGRANLPDPSYCLGLYFTKDGGFSYYTTPELEKITAEAATTVDDGKRGELIKRAVKIVQEDVPSIPIFNNVAVYAMKKNVDFTPTQKYFQDLTLIKDITIK